MRPIPPAGGGRILWAAVTANLFANVSLSGINVALPAAVFAAPNSNAVMSSVPPSKLGVASGIITATRLSGQIGSLSLTSLVFSVMIGAGQITVDVFPQFLRAARLCFIIFAPACFLGAVISLIKDKQTPAEKKKSFSKTVLEGTADA